MREDFFTPEQMETAKEKGMLKPVRRKPMISMLFRSSSSMVTVALQPPKGR